MVKIRLTMTGKRNQRMYRVIAIDEQKKRDGRALEILGYYNPSVRPAQVVLKLDRIEHWVKNGAQVTPSVKKLIDQSQ